MNVTHLYCSFCGKQHEPHRLQNLCNCGKPLMVAYDLDRAKESLTRESLRDRSPTLWRYEEVLPVEERSNRITLGEGMTPLLKAERLGKHLGLHHLYIKDESLNPTASFKARGMAVAVSMAKELGATKLVVPSAGNAAGALAAYAAKAGLEAFIFMPKDTPKANIIECRQTGANVTLIDGLITDCGRILGERKTAEGWFDVSTLKEPYRVEGKKTMGYELAEQFGWELPDVILYPTGGGTGLIGMWKAFDEMERMGWIGSQRPRMIIAVLDWVQYSLSPSQTQPLNQSQMKAYSIDLRRKIIDAYNAQEGSYRQIAKRFRVSLSFVQTLLKRYKDTGRVEPLPHRGGRQLKLNSEKIALLAQLVKKDNDATLEELGEKLSKETQVRVSRATLGKLLQKLQLTRKKKRFMPVNKTASG